MAKEKTDWTTILLIAIVLVAGYIWYVNSQTYTPINVNNQQGIGNTGQSYVDLSSLYHDVISNTNAASSCAAFGGNWYDTPTKVGCWNTAIAINYTQMCTTPAAQASNALCNAAHATSICNYHNIGCYYSG